MLGNVCSAFVVLFVSGDAFLDFDLEDQTHTEQSPKQADYAACYDYDPFPCKAQWGPTRGVEGLRQVLESMVEFQHR